MENSIRKIMGCVLFMTGASMAAVLTATDETLPNLSTSVPRYVNPYVTLTAVPNSSYGVMGVGFLSDGRMLVLTTLSTNLGGGAIVAASADQALYLATGLSKSGSLAGVTFTKILDQLTGPAPGVVVVNDTVYVMDRTAFYRVNSLTPTGGTSKAQNATLIINAPVADSGFSFADGSSWHQYVFTPQYYNGRFYAPYSGSIAPGGRSDRAPTSSVTGGLLSWAKDVIVPPAAGNTGYRRESGGLRSCNGMGGDGMGNFLIADNQGSFVPQNPVYLYKAGQPLRTYGYRQGTTANSYGCCTISNTRRNWAEDLPYQPPVIWIPDNVQQSNSQPLYLDRGPYKGDWIIGDVNAVGLGRLHLDDVDNTGRIQASYHLFTSGIDNATSGTSPGKGINRLAWSPDSAIYVGNIGNRGDWPGSAAGPMTRISFRDTSVFEILAIRSRKNAVGDSNGVELFFSKPINPGTAAASNFTLFQIGVIRTANYGCAGSTGRPCFSQVPQVRGVTVSNDNRKVFLTIATPDTSIGASHLGVDDVGNNTTGVWGGPGKQDRTLRIDVGTGLRSATGEELFHYRHYMGWHYQANTRFNPANSDLKPSTSIQGKAREAGHLSAAVFHRMLPGGVLSVKVNLPGRITVSLYSINGVLHEKRAGSGSVGGFQQFNFNTQSLHHGVHILSVNTGTAIYSRQILF